MQVMTFADTHTQFESILDSAITDKETVVVTRENGEAAVVVSLEEWNAITETLHLLSSPKNADRLRSSIAELDAAVCQKRG